MKRSHKYKEAYRHDISSLNTERFLQPHSIIEQL